MRRILLNHARDRAAGKRGGDWHRVTLESVAIPGGTDPATLIAFNDLFEQLEQRDPQAGEIAKLRIFAGLTVPEIAAAMGIAPRTVDRQWAFARAWLRTHVGPE
jgi:RNA polymerase sigma factor (TIGR02999 family)